MNNLLQKIKTIDPELIQGSPFHITYLNNSNYLKIRSMNLKHITHVGVDGAIFKFLYNIFSKSETIKRTSFDFSSNAPYFFDMFKKNNLSACFIGGKKSEIKKFKDLMISRDSYFTSSGFFSGYINDEGYSSWSEYLNSINLFDYDIFVLGLGAPLQEEISFYINSKNPDASTITCGGFMTQCAKINNLIYFPEITNKLGLRWAYRIFKEPHVWKRIIFDYPPSIVKIIFDLKKIKSKND